MSSRATRVGSARPGRRPWLQLHGTLVTFDVAGFTQATALSQRRSGAEHEAFAAGVMDGLALLVTSLVRDGAEVVSFGGDAVRALLPADRLDVRHVVRRAHRASTLRLRAGAATGPLVALHIGGPNESIIVGATAAAALAAEARSRRGGLVYEATHVEHDVTVPSSSWGGDQRGSAGAAGVLTARGTGWHRHAAIGFVRIRGLHAVADADPRRAARIGRRLADAIGAANAEWINSDTAADGVQITLAAGLAVADEHAPATVAEALRRIVSQAPDGVVISAGMTAGPVFATRTGNDDRPALTVLGDIVNLAARLAALGANGEVLVGPGALGLDDLATTTPEPMAISKRSGSVSVARLAPRRRRTGRSESVELVGRERVVAAVEAALASARDGSGSAVTIVAEAGMGASALANHLARIARPTTAQTITVDRARPDRAEPALRRAAAIEGPALVIVDGVDALTPSGAALATAVTTAAPATGIVAVMIGRPPWGSDARGAFRLEPLDDDAIASVIERAVGRPPTPDRLARLVAHAHGNPRLAVALARAGDEPELLPPSVEAIAALMLDRLPPDQRLLVEHIAELGGDVSPSLLAACDGPDALPTLRKAALTSPIVRVSDDGVRIDDPLVIEAAARTLPHSDRRAVHRRALDHLLDRTDDVRALARHAWAADDHPQIARFAPLAAHAARTAGDHAAALRWWERCHHVAPLTASQALEASDDAERAGRPEDADRWLRTARRGATGREIADLELARARLANRSGEPRRAIRAARRAGRAGHLAMAGIEEAAARLRAGDDERCLANASRWTNDPDPLVRGEAWLLVEMAMGVCGDPGTADAGRRAIAELTTAGALDRAAVAAANAGGTAYNEGRWRDAAQLLDLAAQGFGADAHVAAVAALQATIGLLALDQGRVGDAERFLARARRVLIGAGMAPDAATAAAMHARALARLGQHRRARERLAEADALAGSARAPNVAIDLTLARTEVSCIVGEPDLDALARAHATVDEMGATDALGPVLARFAATASALDHADRHRADEAIESARVHGARYDLAAAIDVLDRLGGATDRERDERDAIALDLDVVAFPPFPITRRRLRGGRDPRP